MERALQIDANGMDDLDYLTSPTGVIAESERLMAEAFQAEKAYFLVNGTTSGVLAMIMSACNPGDKVIIPRNAHNHYWRCNIERRDPGVRAAE